MKMHIMINQKNMIYRGGIKMELAMTNGFIELNQNQLEVIDAGGWGGNLLIGGCTAVGGAAGFVAGGVAGAAAGTVSLPVVGTVAGGAVCAYAGAGAGALAGAGTGSSLASYWGI
jgi:hypothetical protein